MKTCKACKATKPLEAFNVRKDSKDGYRNICKECCTKKVKIGKVIEEVGNTYGYWYVLERANNKPDGSAQWLCKCICNKEKIVPANSLREGTSKSCGCAFTSTMKEKRGPKTLEKRIFRSYKTGAISRNYEFTLSQKEVETLIYSNCYYCGDEPKDIKYFYSKKGVDLTHFILTNGIDRLNNSKGYTLDNCVPCCKFCNQMKSDHSLKEFFEKINKIYNKRVLNE